MSKEFSPRKSILGFLSDLSIYGVGVIIARGLALITTPILTRLFSLTEFGNLDLLLSGVSIIVVISSMYMESALMRYYNDLSLGERKYLMFTHLVSVSCIGGILWAMVCLGRGLICETFFQGQGLWMPVALSGGLILSTLIYQHVITVLRTMRKPSKAVGFSFLVALVQFLLTLAGVILLDLGIMGVIIARLCAELLISSGYIFRLRGEYGTHFSMSILKQMMGFGVPLMPEALLGIIIGYYSKFYLLSSHGTEGMGLFAVAQKMAMLIAVVSGVVKSAWLPYAFSIMSHSESKRIFADILSSYFKIMTVGMAVFILFGWEILWVIAPREYWDARTAGVLLGMAAALQGGVYIVNIGLLKSQKTRWYVLASVGSAAVVFIGSWAFVPVWGVTGASLVQVGSQLVMITSIYLLSQHFYRIDYRLASFWGFIGGTLILLELIRLFPVLTNLNIRMGITIVLIGGGWIMFRREFRLFQQIRAMAPVKGNESDV